MACKPEASSSVPCPKLGLDQRYECPICLSCLKNPTLTSCGHRFCLECINMCLKSQPLCPLDGRPLTKFDVFPDNYTRREILEQLMDCPYTSFGCNVRICPLDVEQHMQSCYFRPRQTSSEEAVMKTCQHCGSTIAGSSQYTHFDECDKAPVSCEFKQVGCDAVLPREEIDGHMESNLHKHLTLHTEAYNKLNFKLDELYKTQMDIKSQEAQQYWDSRPKGCSANNGDTPMGESCKEGKEPTGCRCDECATCQGLLKSMFERIVMLEQKSRVQEIQIENLTTKLSQVAPLNPTPIPDNMFEELTSKVCNGVYVWHITEFSQRHMEMMTNSGRMIYSPGFYTSPFGYKFCARVNVSPSDQSHMALLIHLMKGENDYCLEWPFTGKISFTLINQRFPDRHFKEDVFARGDLASFQRPTQDVNPKGFGYTEFITFLQISSAGYLMNDEIIIKIEVFKV